MADCNVQETCSLAIFLSLQRIANAMNKKNSIATSRNSIFDHGGYNYKSRVNVFMNNKLIHFRTSCMYIYVRTHATWVQPSSIRLVLNPVQPGLCADTALDKRSSKILLLHLSELHQEYIIYFDCVYIIIIYIYTSLLLPWSLLW